MQQYITEKRFLRESEAVKAAFCVQVAQRIYFVGRKKKIMFLKISHSLGRTFAKSFENSLFTLR